MPTERGVKFVIDRLKAARNLSELRDVWNTIAIAYQRKPAIYQIKEQLKQKMEQRK